MPHAIASFNANTLAAEMGRDVPNGNSVPSTSDKIERIPRFGGEAAAADAAAAVRMFMRVGIQHESKNMACLLCCERALKGQGA